MSPDSRSPELSVVVLTRNEEANAEECVRSLLAQDADLEAIVVDSASSDGTLAALARVHDARLKVIPSPRDLPIGEARNVGIAAASARVIAFVSADATVAPGWARAALSALASADLVYGRQEHAPPRLGVAAVVRGLRYHHFRESARRLPPEAYASNVNAAIRREVFARVRYVEEPHASALDDVLFTREAIALGHRVAYEPAMLVRHKDVSTLAGERRKASREGYGWGLLAPQLGLNFPLLAWGALVLVALVASVFLPPLFAWHALAGALWLPALRRVALAGRAYATRPHLLLGALAVAPMFDLAFLFQYVRGLKDRRLDLSGLVEPHGA